MISILITQSLQDFAISEFIAKSSKLCNFSQELANFPQILGLDASRDVISTHIVKESLFLSLKNGMNSLAFSSCPIYNSYIGQTNQKRNESALLVWSTWRRPLICSGRSHGLLSIRAVMVWDFFLPLRSNNKYCGLAVNCMTKKKL